MWIVDLLIAISSLASFRRRKQRCPACARQLAYVARTCPSCGYSFAQAHRRRVDATRHIPLSNWARMVAFASLGTLVVAVFGVDQVYNPNMWGSPLYGTIKLVTLVSIVSSMGVSYWGIKSVFPKERNYAVAQNLIIFCSLILIGSAFLLFAFWGSFAQ